MARSQAKFIHIVGELRWSTLEHICKKTKNKKISREMKDFVQSRSCKLCSTLEYASKDVGSFFAVCGSSGKGQPSQITTPNCKHVFSTPGLGCPFSIPHPLNRSGLAQEDRSPYLPPQLGGHFSRSGWAKQRRVDTRNAQRPGRLDALHEGWLGKRELLCIPSNYGI